MAFDLVMLTLIGCVLEGLATASCGLAFGAAPTITVSFLIVIVAVTRWNLWGLITCPFLAIGTIIGGMNNSMMAYRVLYDVNYQNCGWYIYISAVIGLLSIGLNVIFFKKIGTKKIVSSNLKILGLVLLDFIIYNIIQMFTFRLLCSGSIFEPGSIIYEMSTKDGQIIQHNLCVFGEAGYQFNLYALIVAGVGVIILRSRGVMTNAVDKLVEDRKNAELDRLDRNFTIEEVPDDTKEAKTDESSDTKDSSEI